MVNIRGVNYANPGVFSDSDIVKGEFVIYIKDEIKDIVKVVSVDSYYNYAQIRILKRVFNYELNKI